MLNGKRYEDLISRIRETLARPGVMEYRIGTTCRPEARKKQHESVGYIHFRVMLRNLSLIEARETKRDLISDLASDPKSLEFLKMDPKLRAQSNKALPGAKSDNTRDKYCVIMAWR